MNIQEPGVLASSLRYLFTPSQSASRILFYPTRVGHYFCDKNYYFTSRQDIALQPSHRFHYMLFLVIQGSMELTLDGKLFQAETGETVIFDCKSPHEYHALSDDLEFYWLIFDGISLNSYFDWILEIHEDHPVFRTAHLKDLQFLLERLITHGAGSTHTSEIQISELIYSILCQLMSVPSPQQNENGQLINKAIQYMDTHFQLPLSVEDISATIDLSTSYFTLLFRRQTGCSPHEYLTLRRINHAKELLLSTNDTIHQIAFSSGYNSEENFIRAFKKAVGSSPTAFRKFAL